MLKNLINKINKDFNNLYLKMLNFSFTNNKGSYYYSQQQFKSILSDFCYLKGENDILLNKINNYIKK